MGGDGDFEDYGSAPECVEPSIPAYEYLGNGLVRIFVCKTVRGRMVLDHTDVFSKAQLIAAGTRLLEIAGAMESARLIDMGLSKMLM